MFWLCFSSLVKNRVSKMREAHDGVGVLTTVILVNCVAGAEPRRRVTDYADDVRPHILRNSRRTAEKQEPLTCLRTAEVA